MKNNRPVCVYLNEDLGLGGPGGDVLVYEDDTL